MEQVRRDGAGDRLSRARDGAACAGRAGGLDDAGFRARFAGSPIKRIGRNRFVRNVLYAIGNSADRGLFPVAAALCDDEDGTVAEAARWACERLS